MVALFMFTGKKWILEKLAWFWSTKSFLKN